MVKKSELSLFDTKNVAGYPGKQKMKKISSRTRDINDIIEILWNIWAGIGYLKVNLKIYKQIIYF